LVAPFICGVDGELPTVVDYREAVEAVWVLLNVWRDPTQHALRAEPRLPGDWFFPAVDLNGVPVWGFTYKLTTDWLGLLPKRSPIEQAGFKVARRVLDFLLAHGLKLKPGWEDRIAQPDADERQATKVATVGA